MEQINGVVYILADDFNDKLYVGVTSQLFERMLQHRSNERNGYASWNHIYNLVYYEYFEHISDAIAREKQLKHSVRQYKILLIEKENPGWKDLFGMLNGNDMTLPYE